MGNTFAKNNANDTINWNSIKTDKMSDNNISGGSLSNDSKLDKSEAFAISSKVPFFNKILILLLSAL